MTATRTPTWLESLGEWSWPGQRSNVAEMLPPAWVPATPPARGEASAAAAPLPVRAPHARRIAIAGLLSALIALGATIALRGELGLDGGAGVGSLATATHRAPSGPRSLLAQPSLRPYSRDGAGSAIEHASYASVALGHEGSFYVYLPPGYDKRSTTQRYPVLYLLHGNDQSATAFLHIGLQGELDSLIDHHSIPPLIAVMIQGGRGANNWRDVDGLEYESYVLEVQEMIDRMLPTIADRGGRAIAGDSMGGYGAMELTLDNPYRFGVVESWLGFFNGLEDQLRLDSHTIEQLGLRAFVYGGAEDHIADPAEDAPFAAQLRAVGAQATSAIYQGEHNLETLEAHLNEMLVFAGRSLSAASSVQKPTRQRRGDGAS